MTASPIASGAALPALLACGAAACGDNELGPGSVLSRDDAESLTAALNGAELGSFAGYAAIATQVHVTELRDNGEAITRWIGVMGWSGYDGSTEAFAEATGAFHTLFESPPFPGSFDQNVTDGGLLAFARGVHRNTLLSGHQRALHDDVGELREQGSAEYVVDRFSGSGAATFTLQSATYDLPAARLVITVDNTTN